MAWGSFCQHHIQRYSPSEVELVLRGQEGTGEKWQCFSAARGQLTQPQVLFPISQAYEPPHPCAHRSDVLPSTVCMSSCSSEKATKTMAAAQGDDQGFVTKPRARKSPTIIVNPAIVVFIPIFHQFFYVILSDGLSCGLQHDLELLEVDVAISISVPGQKSSGPDRAAGEGEAGWLHPPHHPTTLCSWLLLVKHPEEV